MSLRGGQTDGCERVGRVGGGGGGLRQTFSPPLPLLIIAQLCVFNQHSDGR